MPTRRTGGLRCEQPGRALRVICRRLFIPKDKPNSARREKVFLIFLKRFGLFPFVRSEHKPTSTKNENKKCDSSMLKKVNRLREQKEYVSAEMFNAK